MFNKDRTGKYSSPFISRAISEAFDFSCCLCACRSSPQTGRAHKTSGPDCDIITVLTISVRRYPNDMNTTPILSSSSMSSTTNRSPSEQNSASEHKASLSVGGGGVPTTRHSPSPSIALKVPEPDWNTDRAATSSSDAPLKSNEKQLSVDQAAVARTAVDAVKLTLPTSDNDDEVLPDTAQANNDNADNNDDDEQEGKVKFPRLLHKIVSDPATDEYIHWLPCGTRFTIPDKKKFAKYVLPLFNGHAKFTSFTRRLKRWGFSRCPSGPFAGSYVSVNFVRGDVERVGKIKYVHPKPLSGEDMQRRQEKISQVMGDVHLGGAAGAGNNFGGYFGGSLDVSGVGMGGGGIGALSEVERMGLLQQLASQQKMQQQQQQQQQNDHQSVDALLQRVLAGNAGPTSSNISGASTAPMMISGNGGMAAISNSLAIQMAMAQEMKRRQQQGLGTLGQTQASPNNINESLEGLLRTNPSLALQLLQSNNSAGGAQQPQQQSQSPSNKNLMSLLDSNNSSQGLALYLQQQQQHHQQLAPSNELTEEQRLRTAILMAQLQQNNMQNSPSQQFGRSFVSLNTIASSNPALSNKPGLSSVTLQSLLNLSNAAFASSLSNLQQTQLVPQQQQQQGGGSNNSSVSNILAGSREPSAINRTQANASFPLTTFLQQQSAPNNNNHSLSSLSSAGNGNVNNTAVASNAIVDYLKKIANQKEAEK